jgi:hypothetical protein
MGATDINKDGVLNPVTFLLHFGFIIGMLLIILVVIPFFIPLFPADSNSASSSIMLGSKLDNINDRLTSIEGKLEAMGTRLEAIDTRLSLIQSDVTSLKAKKAGGNLAVNENGTIYNISIALPLNDSILFPRFNVNGTTNLTYELCENGLYKIYLVSKLGDKYWIQTEAYPDVNGNWQGYRPCFVPNKFNNSTIYAVISKNEYLLASSFDKIPEHISISEPITVKIKNSDDSPLQIS